MSRLAALLCLTLFIGPFCTFVTAEAFSADVIANEDSKDAHRKLVQKYLMDLTEVKSAEEEKRLLTELSKWLDTHRYKVQVEGGENGKYRLLCPYFPPVTPWIEHTFFDADNLKLLPRLKTPAMK